LMFGLYIVDAVWVHQSFGSLLIRPLHATFILIGVAFKKQRIVDSSNYKLAASIASHFMDVVCTSGQKTGSAPDINKIRAFREACGDTCLAVASGITPDNISQYSNMVDIILVATGKFRLVI